MSIRIRKAGSTSFSAGALEVDISHINDSIKLGDGTNLIGTFTDIGGTRSLPVDVKTTTLATNSTLTGGTQQTKITDGTDVVGISTVGAAKALKVDVIQSVGGAAGGTSMTDDVAFTVGTSSVTPMGALADETAPDSVDEGDIGALRMTLDRLLKVQLAGVAASIAVPVTDNGGSLTVDGTVAATQSGVWNITNVSGTVSLPTGAATSAKQDTEIASLQLLDDVVFTDDAAFTVATSKGIAIGAQADETAPDSVDEGDFGVLRMTLDRLLKVQLAGVASGVAVPITDNGGSITVDGTFWQATQPVSGTVTASNAAGDTAHDAADAGNPVKIGGKAANAFGTAVANGDRVNAMYDLRGRNINSPHGPRETILSTQTTITASTTETTIVAAGGAGVFRDLIGLVITNSSATGTLVTLKDVTAGTTRAIYYVPATGGIVINPNVAIPQATANSAWTLTCGTSVSSIYVQAITVSVV